ncbi:MAG: hypothetical protein PF444_07115 [Bacteroidales bacterium]|nr:hypothetical protein [Bacteroidales bacterium]
MATITSTIKSNSTNSSISLRLSIDRKNVFMRKTGFIISSKNWSKKKAELIQRTSELKNLKTDLQSLQNHVLVAYNNSNTKGEKYQAIG